MKSKEEPTEPLHFSRVRTRLFIQTDEKHPNPNENRELDVVAEAESGQTLLVELKMTKEKIGIKPIRTFLDKAHCYARLHPDREVLTAFFSAGGFTPEAEELCEKQTIGTATEFFFFKEDSELFSKS
jgi:hypothetical protein